MTENPIYLMLRKDFERFPDMWMAYVDRRASDPSPLHEMARAILEKDLARAEAAFSLLDEAFRHSPTGQVGRAMLDAAKSGQLNEWIRTK